MFTTSLRKVGGSIMMAVPPAILDLLQLKNGTSVGLTVEDGRLVVQARHQLRYTLEELIAQCEPAAEDDDNRVILDAPPVGKELL
jgi:antitoxin ChpS